MSASSSVRQRGHIRWMIRRDMPTVLDIEKRSFTYPNSEEDFLRELRNSKCIGTVITIEENVVGYMIYELLKGKIRLLKLAVDLEYRRKGLATLMINKLKSKLSDHRRTSIILDVPDYNLGAQLFFKSQNFFATRVLKNADEHTDSDMYYMCYKLVTSVYDDSPVVEV